MRTKLVIPAIPPSVNHYWGSRGKRRFLTKEAREWKEIVRLYCMMQLKGWELIKKPVKIKIIFYCDYKGDLDNRLKATLDALNGVVWQDDKLVEEILARRVKSKKKYTIIVIETIEKKEGGRS